MLTLAEYFTFERREMTFRTSNNSNVAADAWIDILKARPMSLHGGGRRSNAICFLPYLLQCSPDKSTIVSGIFMIEGANKHGLLVLHADQLLMLGFKFLIGL